MQEAQALTHRPAPPYRGGTVGLAGRVGTFGVVLFGVTLYALPQYLFPVLEPLRVGVLTAALMGAGLVARWLFGGAMPTGGGLRILGLAAFVVATALSPLWSYDPEISRWAAGEALKMGLVYLAAASLLDRPARLHKVVWAVGLAGCVPAWYALSNYLTGTDLLEGYRARWLGTFLDPNRLAMALVASAALLLGIRSRLRHPVLQLLALLALGLQVAAVVVTYSRGGALGLAAALLAYLVVGKGGKRMRSGIAVSAVLVGLLFLAPEQFWNRTETIATFEEDASAMGRIHAWQTASAILERKPLTGVGASAFIAAWPHFAPGEAGRTAYVAHNLLLEVAAELGLPALAGFLALLGACTWGAWKASRSPAPVPEAGRAIFAALVGYFVCQMFAGYMLSFFLFFFLGLATAAERLSRRARVASPAPGS